jgi:hypothetical protein
MAHHASKYGLVSPATARCKQQQHEMASIAHPLLLRHIHHGTNSSATGATSGVNKLYCVSDKTRVFSKASLTRWIHCIIRSDMTVLAGRIH